MPVGHWQLLNDLPDLALNHDVIKRVDKTQHFGVNTDESLNWKKQYKLSKIS